ncbi:hypothetical protein IAT40_004545 [Kwoniella sp. CBS 6097]
MPRSHSRSRSRSPSRSRSRSRTKSRSVDSRPRSISRSRSRSPVVSEDVTRGRTASLEADQTVTSPFLIRVFVTKGKHTPLVEFDEGNFPLRDEFQLYGWKSSTPTSLIRMLLPSFPAPYRSPLARYAFRHIYVDASSRGLYRSKDLVSFSGRDIFPTSNSTSEGMDIDGGERSERNSSSNSKSRRPVEEKTLDEYDFVTGDLLSVSLYIPEPKIPTGAGAGAGGASTSASTSSGALASGPGGPRIGNGGAFGARDRQASGSGAHAQSFGWNDRTRDGPGPAHGRGQNQIQNRDEVKGHWGRGAPLPPQEIAGAGGGRRNGRAGAGDSDIAGGGNWRGGGHGGGAGGFGIRGRGGRRSPEYGGRRESLGTGGERDDRRSRSPDLRSRDKRESWSSRR